MLLESNVPVTTATAVRMDQIAHRYGYHLVRDNWNGYRRYFDRTKIDKQDESGLVAALKAEGLL